MMSIRGSSFFSPGGKLKKEKKNFNQASLLPAALGNEKNEAESGKSKESRRGQTVLALSTGAREMYLQCLNLGSVRRGAWTWIPLNHVVESETKGIRRHNYLLNVMANADAPFHFLDFLAAFLYSHHKVGSRERSMFRKRSGWTAIWARVTCSAQLVLIPSKHLSFLAAA